MAYQNFSRPFLAPGVYALPALSNSSTAQSYADSSHSNSSYSQWSYPPLPQPQPQYQTQSQPQPPRRSVQHRELQAKIQELENKNRELEAKLAEADKVLPIDWQCRKHEDFLEQLKLDIWAAFNANMDELRAQIASKLKAPGSWSSAQQLDFERAENKAKLKTMEATHQAEIEKLRTKMDHDKIKLQRGEQTAWARQQEAVQEREVAKRERDLAMKEAKRLERVVDEYVAARGMGATDAQLINSSRAKTDAAVKDALEKGHELNTLNTRYEEFKATLLIDAGMKEAEMTQQIDELKEEVKELKSMIAQDEMPFPVMGVYARDSIGGENQHFIITSAAWKAREAEFMNIISRLEDDIKGFNY